MIRKKVCLLGGSCVGKTSLCRRFVHSIFNDAYRTTIGVKIEKKEISTENEALALMLWDMEGDDVFTSINRSYLRGASGFLMVVDGTRPRTLEKVTEILDRLASDGIELPTVIALNKSDLETCIKPDDPQLQFLSSSGLNIVSTSAKTGDGVENAFHILAGAMMAAKKC